MTAPLPSLADSLIQSLHQPGQERLLDLVRNPLRLTLLCITWDGTLPETQAQLYENYLKKFYDWNQNLQELRDCAERCQTNITALKNQLNRQLGELAKAALDLPQERFRLSQALVEKYLGEELDDKSLCYLALQLGWLNRVGKDNRDQFIFAFYHATFQEYFAALAVDDWDYFLPRNHVNFPVAGKEYRIFEPQWKQVILLWLGRGDVVDEEKEGFIEKLVNFGDGCGEWNFEKVDRGFYEYRAYFLAAVGISEFKSCSIGDVIVQQMVRAAFSYFNEEKQEWQDSLVAIRETARQVLLETLREQVITDLIRLLQTNQNEYILRSAAESLGKLDPGNYQALAKLLRLLESTGPGYDRSRVAESLLIIDPRNSQAIKVLLDLLKSNESKYTQSLAANILDKIDIQNPQIINFLVKIIETTKDEFTLIYTAGVLGNIRQYFSLCVTTLIKIIESTNNDDICFEAVHNLYKIDPDNPRSIVELVRIIETTITEDIRWRAIIILGEIGYSKPKIINKLIQIIDKDRDAMALIYTAEILGKISQYFCMSLNTLLEIIKTTKHELICIHAAEVLEKIAPNNPYAIPKIVIILKNTEDEFTPWDAAFSLERILSNKEKQQEVIIALKSCFSNEVYQSNSDRFENCYKVFWNIAQNLPYPDFYRAWHGLTETQTSPLVQTLNLAQLPQLLQTQLTETNLHQTLQLLCIDGSKFDNRDRPATDIYLQLVKKHHCPKSTEGTPRTLTELKIYWQLLDWEKHPILIFYEEAKPQGFSQTFLDFLDRFDATVCVITDSPHPTIPTFSTQDPHLIQNIMNWVQRTILEG